MILKYTNKDKKFSKDVGDLLDHICITIPSKLVQKINSVKVLSNIESGFIFYISYKDNPVLLEDLQSMHVELNLFESVRSVEASSVYGNLSACLILNDLSDLSEILDLMHFEEMKSISLIIETANIDEPDDIHITKVFSEVMGCEELTSICEMYITKSTKLDKQAFDMYLAAMYSRFINTGINFIFFLDFDIDVENFMNYLDILTGDSNQPEKLKNSLIRVDF